MNTQQKTRDCGPQRSATTLVEVMTVVVLASVVFGVAISLLISLKQRDRTIQHAGVRTEQFLQLAESIRADIRLAADVSLPDQNTLLVTQTNDRQVRYEAGREGCRRTVDATDGGDLQSESFAIGATHAWTLQQDDSGRLRLISITLAFPKPDDAENSPVPLLIYATLGADAPNR
jgi:hypothetical protein